MISFLSGAFVRRLLCGAQAWFIAGIFVLLALPVSIYEVAMQLEYFSRPKMQIYVIRILWMVPVYSLDSWLALRFEVGPHASPFPTWHCQFPSLHSFYSFQRCNSLHQIGGLLICISPQSLQSRKLQSRKAAFQHVLLPQAY